MLIVTQKVCRTNAMLLGLIAMGCGADPEQYEITSLSGIVTCEGKPVANAVVNFTPIADANRKEGRPGRPALGRTDESGRFTLTTYENDDGVIIGKHTVTVGAGFDESTGNNTRFSCADATKEVTVEAGMREIKLDF